MATGDTLLIYTALNGEPPATGTAAFAVRNQHSVVGFDDTAQEYMVFTGVVPNHYDGAGMDFLITWTCTTVLALTEAGDTGGYFATWALTGGSYANSNGGIWYWNLTVAGSNYTVTLYKDVAKTQSVATGTRTGVGTLTLSATNASGLTGSVVISGTPVTDTDAGNTLTANRVQWGIFVEKDTNYDIDADNWGAAKTTYDPAPNVGGTMKTCEISFTPAELPSLSSGDLFRFRITRYSGVTPNITGDCQIKTIEIRES
jgi:hypothetical protein